MILFITYWITCGLISFSLINSTASVFKSNDLLEFIISMLLGGIIVPILFIAWIHDWTRIVLFEINSHDKAEDLVA